MFREITGINDENVISAIQMLPSFYYEGGWEERLSLEFFRLPTQGEEALQVTKEASRCRIGYREKIHLFRALGILRENALRERFCCRERMFIPQIGAMLDVSRNSVPDIAFLNKILDRMALMGMNCLILYMEDVYELEGEPRFGYMRGGYTREQLRLLDDYADRYGIRVIASIQVLGHLEKVLRFPEYASVKDSPSCLLVGADKTYELIRKMLGTIGQCLRSRLVIVGMDETHGLGEGEYRRQNGARAPLDIFLEHLQRVHALARENGLETARYLLGLYLDGSLPGLPELETPRYEKDRRGNYLGNGIWKVYSETAALSDG